MYNHCVDKMADAGVAVEFDDPIWMNRACENAVKTEVYKCKVTFKIIHPDCATVEMKWVGTFQ